MKNFKSRMNLLICYTELAEYTIACVNEFIEQTGAKVHIIKWPVKDEAPFKFANLNSNITFYERNKFNDESLLELAKKINPQLILTAGWIDKGYMKIAKHFYGKVPTVLLFDNKWQNTIKQKIAVILSSLILKNKFSHCFVPGNIQKKYAKKLGFKEDKIITGFYSCDYNRFKSYLESYRADKKRSFPKRFLYVGRYLELKGLSELWQAFIELQNENPSEWELWCIGTGEMQPVLHPKIKHIGFIQPDKFLPYLKDTGVFILASRKEAWSVALHEMVTAGFPVICSNQVGAIEAFVDHSKNGYVFEAGDKNEIKNRLENIIQKTDNELIEMGLISEKLAEKITPKIWSNSLKQLIKT